MANRLKVLLLSFGIISLAQANENDVLKIETTIKGNKESPQFLSIVPWRVLHQTKLDKVRLIKSLNKSFKPLEPEELKSQLKLYNELVLNKTKNTDSK